jgi:hypothetical protein
VPIEHYKTRQKNNPMDYNFQMFTIAELPEYIRRVEKLMSAAERLNIVNYLAAHPKAGDLMPLYLLTLFAMNERANIRKAERNELAELVELLVQIWMER